MQTQSSKAIPINPSLKSSFNKGFFSFHYQIKIRYSLKNKVSHLIVNHDWSIQPTRPTSHIPLDDEDPVFSELRPMKDLHKNKQIHTVNIVNRLTNES